MGLDIVNFWCGSCRQDYGLVAKKKYVNAVIEEAWVSRCPDCDKRLYRLRDEMAGLDPYFRLSRHIRAQVRRNADYLVQQNDPRFNILYPQHAKQKAAEENATERKTYADIAAKF